MLEGLKPVKKIRPCRIREILAGLDDSDKDILETALADFRNWSTRGLEKALKGRGVEVSDTSIERHRNGICSC